MIWAVKKLGDICDIVSGATPKTSVKEYWGDDYFWATPKDLSDLNGPEIETTSRKISGLGLKSCAANLLPVGSVLFSSRAPIGLVAINKVPIATNQGFKNLVPNKNLVDEKYLYHWLLFNRKKIDAMGVGATFKEVSKAIVSKIEIPLPPLSEQQRTAILLDSVDCMLKLREASLKKLDLVAQSIFEEMFSNQKSKIEKLSSVCDLQNGFAFKSDDYVEDSNVLNCRMSNIRPNGDFDIFYNARYLQDNFADKYKEYLLNDGDVIIAMTDMAGEPKILGVPTIVETKGKKLLLNQRVGKVIFKKQNTLNIDYLKYALTQTSVKNYFKKFANGGVQINLGKVDLLSVPIAIPSYELQTVFSSKIQSIFNLKKLATKELAAFRMLKTSLQNQSFSVN